VANYTVKKIEDMEAVFAGGFKRARAELGVSAWGMQVLDIPPDMGDRYPEHDHGEDGMEEVYVVLRGSAEIEIEGERHPLDTETMVRVGPGVKRKLWSGPQGARILALGGVPGKPYQAPDITQLGAPDPLAQRS
jgi:mannose-6-phosphate isomerase-like protein (cupin superfamily)